jgi:L-rhamnose mutarotase
MRFSTPAKSDAGAALILLTKGERQVSMQSFGLALNLKNDPQAIERYKAYHQNVWPEVAAALKHVGITSMKIYLIGRKLFMYMEAADGFVPERDFPKYLAMDDRCKQWDDLMRTFQEKIPEAGEDEWWALMEPVYEL